MTDRALMKKDQLASQDRSDRRAVKRARQSFASTFTDDFHRRRMPLQNSEIAHHSRPWSRAMLGAISSSRCQTTRVRLMPLATSTCDTKTDAETQNSGRAKPDWWSQTGSNRRPPACKAGALPTELWPRSVGPPLRMRVQHPHNISQRICDLPSRSSAGTPSARLRQATAGNLRLRRLASRSARGAKVGGPGKI